MKTKNKNRTLFFLLSFLIIHCSLSIANATIRYVSTTGSSTPPYTTWETAADSIQECIDYSVDGDTIIVANAVYKETLFINKEIWLLGSSTDSTIIDGRGLNGINIDFLTVEISATTYMNNFTIIGKAPTGSVAVRASFSLLFVQNCIIKDCEQGVQITESSSSIRNTFIINISGTGCSLVLENTNYPSIEGNLIVLQNGDSAISQFDFGNPTITNNIMIGRGSYGGIVAVFGVSSIFIKNNIISGFEVFNIDTRFTYNTALIENNVTTHQIFSGAGSIWADSDSDVRNNIVAHNNGSGISGDFGVGFPVTDYNLFWENGTNTGGGVTIDSTDVLADPMFVNDTIPVYGESYDYHLQKYSPAIDAGDPTILDIDGSRSDIGVFGGPLGEMYTYSDLAPKPPANLTAVYDSGLVKLTWNKNTEADLFRYRVYRDTVANFIYDTTKIIAVTADTFYYDDLPEKYLAGNYYYKITAIDSAYHQSAASEEVHIKVTGAPEGPPIVVDEYKLLNNYPNPFNPSTKIPYRLKEGGYVKLMVYDIKGELLKVLVNEYQSPGFYEVEFNPNQGEIQRGRLEYPFATGYRGDIASGIYLYRIEVIGEGRIPRFSDMKKMILVK